MKHVLALLLAALILNGCALSIAEVQKSPERYHDREISIQGSVLKVTRLPLLPLDMLDVYDQSGTLTVISLKQGAYSLHQKVRLQGRLYAFNNQNLDDTLSNLEKQLTIQLRNKTEMQDKQIQSAVTLVFNLLRGFLKEKVNVMILLEN